MISSASTIDESELARKIVYQWEEGILNAYRLLKIYVYVCIFVWMYLFISHWICYGVPLLLQICGAASFEVRQAYKQFIAAVVELIDGEVPSEAFREVALTAYRLFGPVEEDNVDRNIAEKK